MTDQISGEKGSSQQKSKVIDTINATAISPAIEIRMEENPLGTPFNFAGDFGQAVEDALKMEHGGREILRASFLTGENNASTIWSTEYWSGVDKTTSTHHHRLYKAYKKLTGIPEDGDIPEVAYAGKITIDSGPDLLRFYVDDLPLDLAVALVSNIVTMHNGNISIKGSINLGYLSGSANRYRHINIENSDEVRLTISEDPKHSSKETHREIDIKNLRVDLLAENLSEILTG